MSVGAIPVPQLSPSTAAPSLPSASPLAPPPPAEPTPAPTSALAPTTSRLSRTFLVLLLNASTILLATSDVRATSINVVCALVGAYYSSEIVTDWVQAGRKRVDKGGVPVRAQAGRADGSEVIQVFVLVTSVVGVWCVGRKVCTSWVGKW